MEDKTKKIIFTGAIVLLALVVLIAITILVWPHSRSGPSDSSNEPASPESRLDQFLRSEKIILDPAKARKRGLAIKEITVPIKTRASLSHLYLVPTGAAGGDSIYLPVWEDQQGNFSILQYPDYKNIFSINSAQEAANYIDFVRVKLGSSAYDRLKKTVWNPGDYKITDCKDKNGQPVASSITPLPLTQATVSSNGYEVSWIYYTPAISAGYWKQTYFVSPDGSFRLEENVGRPFWPCGGSILF
jgi:hypothetical protein